MSNNNLVKAKRVKNDEFYTQFNDIETELIAYYEYNHEVFRNKIVLCPCDDPERSNFVRFFATNFKKYGIKTLISTSYANSGMSEHLTNIEKNSSYYDEGKHSTHGKLFIMTSDMISNDKIDSDVVSFQRYLQGDGDFRSDEVTRLRDKADIIVTNPPFSLFREFLKWIREGEKQFIILGNKNALTYKEVFPLIKENKTWLGTTSPTKFIEPNGMTKRLGNINWFTNVEHGMRHKKMVLDTMANNLRFNKSLRKRLTKYGDLNHYPKYDNYNAIEIPIVKGIPSDYEGMMGVPITFLDYYSPEQFEIIGISGNLAKPMIINNHKHSGRFYINGQRLYDRLVIKHKKN